VCRCAGPRKGDVVTSKPRTPGEKFVEKIKSIFAMIGSTTGNEHENARGRLLEILKKHGKTWNDAIELLQTGNTSNWNLQNDDDDVGVTRAPPGATVFGVTPSGAKITALDFVHHMLGSYVGMQPHEYVAAALWIAHTHAYDRFMNTPRLALTSPVRGCGKTTLLKIIERLVPRARRMDGVSAAAIYRLVDRESCSLLVDEADNLGLFTDGPQRATFNSGHAKGGKVVRAWKDGVREYATFAPMAIAAIGFLPLPISHRSVTIHMMRYAGAEPLRRFDDTDTTDLDITYDQLLLWSRKAKRIPILRCLTRCAIARPTTGGRSSRSPTRSDGNGVGARAKPRSSSPRATATKTSASCCCVTSAICLMPAASSASAAPRSYPLFARWTARRGQSGAGYAATKIRAGCLRASSRRCSHRSQYAPSRSGRHGATTPASLRQRATRAASSNRRGHRTAPRRHSRHTPGRNPSCRPFD
jgi:hypothetical protein